MDKKRLLMASAITNAFEWYDYALFGNLALIIGQKFLPSTDSTASLLNAFLIFAIGFLARPLGGILFGILGDRVGRKAALSNAILCMAIATAAICVTPTYETIGIFASILILVIRIAQGLSMGGTFPSSISFTVEHAKKERKGFVGSLSMFGCCVGILTGSLVCYVTKISFEAEQFDQWAWRIPFIIGLFIFFLGFYIKKHMSETPEFELARSKGQVTSSPLKQALRHHWPALLIAIFIKATGVILFFLESLFFATYLETNRGIEKDLIINFCYIIMALATLLMGLLADKFSRKNINIINTILTLVLMPVLLFCIESGGIYAVILSLITIAFFNSAHMGTGPTLTTELFPTQIRSTALSTAYSIGSIFGGLAPYIAERLLQTTGSLLSLLYYIMPCGFLSLIALYFYDRYSQATSQSSV